MEKLHRFFKAEEGSELAEWAVMAALLIAGVLIAIQALSGGMSAAFNRVTGVITGGNS